MINVQIYRDLYSGYKNNQTEKSVVLDAIKKPQTRYYDREIIPLWSFYIPVKDPTLNKQGEPIGCGDNMQMLYMLQLDYDDNIVRIDQFVEEHKDIEFWLYTSYRHSDAHHKFRVLIPLDAAYGNNLLKPASNKELLLAMFPGCDKSTINSFRKQRIPALNPDRPDDYRYVINEGKRMGLPYKELHENYNAWSDAHGPRESKIDNDDDFASIFSGDDEYIYNIKGLYVPRPLPVHECTRRHVITEMSKLPWGSRGGGVVHYTLCRLYGKLRTSGWSQREAVEIMLDEAPPEAYSEIEGIGRMD